MTFVKCSRCHSEVLEEFFSRNRKGVLNKCCDNCLKRFRCEQCEYRTSHKHHLKMHVKQVHDKIKDVKCDIDQCEYVCSHKHHLKMHAKQVHDKIKDVKCDQCEYVCSLKHHLKMHVKQVHDRVMGSATSVTTHVRELRHSDVTPRRAQARCIVLRVNMK